MGIPEQFTNLGEDFMGAFDARVNFLGKNVVDVHNHTLDTHRQLNRFRKDHKAMARNLKVDLGAFVDDLSETVAELRRNFRRGQQQIHRDCEAAHHAWQRVSKAMAGRRRNFTGSLAAAKKKAARTH